MKYLKMLWHIWPDLMQLFKHAKEVLPKEDQIPAVQHALKTAKDVATQEEPVITVRTYNTPAQIKAQAKEDERAAQLAALEDE